MTTTGLESDELRKTVGDLDGVAAAHVVSAVTMDGEAYLRVYLAAEPGTSRT